MKREAFRSHSVPKGRGTKKVLASLISILVGLLVGGIAVILVGCFNEKISLSGAWDGFRIIFAGIFSTGRNAAR